MDRNGRLKVVSAALRSGARRYPKELAKSLRGAGPGPAATEFRRAWEQAIAESVTPVAWLGHASVLLRMSGLNVLVDPVLSDRIGPRIGPLTIGVNRLVSPPLRPADLPQIDIVAISHPHFDHLDKPTLRALAGRATSVVTARNTATLIPRGFRAVVELDWGERWEHAGIEFSAIRPRHWGARTAWDRHRGYNAYLIESARSRVLCAGDTAYTPAFDSIGRTDLAVFGIGAYDPWRHAHATPEEVWTMASAAGASEILPVHHSTFELSDEPIHEPLQRLLTAAGSASSRVLLASPGEVIRYGRG